MTAMGMFVRYRLPAILWAILIFVGSSIPTRMFPSVKWFEFDKFIHTTIFFILALLVYRAFQRSLEKMSFQWMRALLVVLLVMAYGILDEFHQNFVPGRSPDIRDATANTLGGVLAMIVLLGYYRLRGPKVRSGS